MPNPFDPQPLNDNPHGEDFHKLKDDGRRFRVTANGVGRHVGGAVVSARDLGPGAELPRLSRLGAITELTASEVHNHNETLRLESAAGDEPPVVQPTGTNPKPPQAALPQGAKPDVK